MGLRWGRKSELVYSIITWIWTWSPELHDLLAKRGYDVGALDGAIGDKTKDAIADFQGKNGLTVDGRASVKVLEALRR